jgi:glucose/arabinose dehydrogenase
MSFLKRGALVGLLLAACATNDERTISGRDGNGGEGGEQTVAGEAGDRPSAARGGAAGSRASGGTGGPEAGEGGETSATGARGASGGTVGEEAGQGGEADAGGTGGGGRGGSSGATTGGSAGTGVACPAVVEEGWDIDPTYVTGATGATDIAFHADGRAVVTRKAGQVTVRLTDGTTNQSTPFSNVDSGSEKGLLGVVADPNVAVNDAFYFYVSDGSTDDDKHRVYRGTLLSDSTFDIDLSSPIVSASRGLGPGLQGPANHDGGGLLVHKGKLYVSVGDTGANATPPSNRYASCLDKPNGSILRVNLDGTIPTDNPLVSIASVTACTGVGGPWTMGAPDQRIYAWGFRNPWRFWIDPQTDLLWIGDVGEQTKEEISVGGGNAHYGYPFHEGNTEWGSIDGIECNIGFLPGRTCTPPVHDYTHAEGTSVTGGLIPEGCGWQNVWPGKTYYLFGDYGGGWIRALDVRPDRKGVVSSTAVTIATVGGGPASFRMGPDDALYVVLHAGSAVYRFSPKTPCGPACR